MPELLVAKVWAIDSDGLQTVDTYTRTGSTFQSLRDDGTCRQDNTADDVHDESVLQGPGTESFEDLFEASSPECSLHRFEEMRTTHVIHDACTFLFVSVDWDADFPSNIAPVGKLITMPGEFVDG